MTAPGPDDRRLRILVTGGSGFIGRHVVSALQSAGHQVHVADRNPFPDDTVSWVGGDLCDADVRDRAVTADLDAIVHLAAETSVLGSIEQPALVHRTNVEMTAGLLELARQRSVGTFVLASTNAVVGAVTSTITEDLPLLPLTPYGATKAAAEMLMSGYAGAYGMRTPAIRLTNVYGPGMVAKDSFVPRLMRAAAEGHGVQIYGDGQQRRDLVYVKDAAHAFVLGVTTWPSGPVIVAGGSSYTVEEIAQAARDATGQAIPGEHVDPKPGEMPAVVVDLSRARSRGYQPSRSLEEGMRDVWADFAPSLRV
ncbi:MAG: NAD-dependent epimerase/dehydratase family protein [Nocardioidaceae bacterium]